ncbi:MAG TPA: hypothetical protein VJC13_00145 [Candidatus Paceibacterota bacterium]
MAMESQIVQRWTIRLGQHDRGGVVSKDIIQISTYVVKRRVYQTRGLSATYVRSVWRCYES